MSQIRNQGANRPKETSAFEHAPKTLPDFLPCGACKGEGTIVYDVYVDSVVGTTHAPNQIWPCLHCDGSGFSDHIRRECPHCGELVRPSVRYETYARQIWHPACLETVMEEQSGPATKASLGQLALRVDSLLFEIADYSEYGPETNIACQVETGKLLKSVQALIQDASKAQPDTGVQSDSVKACTAILESLRGSLGEIVRKLDKTIDLRADLYGGESLGTEVYACLMQVDLALSQLRRKSYESESK